MTKVLVTGMSGTGKSCALEALGQRGHDVVDTDTDEWCRWTRDDEGRDDWIWREEAMARLLLAPRAKSLFVAGCKSNQGDFYSHFSHVVLLDAPLEVLLERVAHRTGNPYGQRDLEREEISLYAATIVPQLRRSASRVVDDSQSLDDVVAQLELLA